MSLGVEDVVEATFEFSGHSRYCLSQRPLSDGGQGSACDPESVGAARPRSKTAGLPYNWCSAHLHIDRERREANIQTSQAASPFSTVNRLIGLYSSLFILRGRDFRPPWLQRSKPYFRP